MKGAGGPNSTKHAATMICFGHVREMSVDKMHGSAVINPFQFVAHFPVYRPSASDTILY